MTKEDKLTQIEELTTVLNDTPTIYLADIAASMLIQLLTCSEQVLEKESS